MVKENARKEERYIGGKKEWKKGGYEWGYEKNYVSQDAKSMHKLRNQPMTE